VKDRYLVALNELLVVMIVVHDLDHVRQGRALQSELFGVGAVALVTGIISLVLAVRAHWLAPAAAAVVGFGNVVGVALVHVAPHWGPFSDPYSAAHVDWFSWTVIVTMMFVGLLLGIAGMRALRHSPRTRRPAVSTSQ
jgi:formate hydrogenlyase subunit 3/multisubunit Na+/H+ antiporter MnhD subunit